MRVKCTKKNCSFIFSSSRGRSVFQRVPPRCGEVGEPRHSRILDRGTESRPCVALGPELAHHPPMTVVRSIVRRQHRSRHVVRSPEVVPVKSVSMHLSLIRASSPAVRHSLSLSILLAKKRTKQIHQKIKSRSVCRSGSGFRPRACEFKKRNQINAPKKKELYSKSKRSSNSPPPPPPSSSSMMNVSLSGS